MSDSFQIKCPHCGSERIGTNETLGGVCGISSFHIEDGELRHEYDDDGTQVGWDTAEVDEAQPYICRNCGTLHTLAAIVASLPAELRAEITAPVEKPAPDRLQVLAGLVADLAKHAGAIERKQRTAGPIEPEEWHRLRVLVREAEILSGKNPPPGFVLIDRDTLGALCEASEAAAALKAEDEETARDNGEDEAADEYGETALAWQVACETGRAILAGQRSAIAPAPELLDEGELCVELENYCEAQGLPHMSADELAASDHPNDEQREWLRDFCERWERWEDQQRAASAAADVVADAEGWGIFNGGEVQRDDEANTFASDDDARAYVERMAAAGSPVHAAALRRVAALMARELDSAERADQARQLDKFTPPVA